MYFWSKYLLFAVWTMQIGENRIKGNYPSYVPLIFLLYNLHVTLM